MSDIARAIDPAHHAVIHASAGTGKTWLLTSRIVRLLLAGAAPGTILAITFTRKAAGEMQERIRQRLYRFASVDDAALRESLVEIRAATDAETMRRARSLYENFLREPHGLRATTFHAFCQELLRRFPLEANVPPGFELLENTGALRETAWRAFDADVTSARDSALVDAFDTLARLGSLQQLRHALDLFVEHRSDWWAFIAGVDDPMVHAVGSVRQALGFTADTDPHGAPPFPAMLRDLVARYAALLGRHDTDTHRERVEQLQAALELASDSAAAFPALQRSLFTQEGKPRELKRSRALVAAVGESETDELLALHRQLTDRILALRDELQRRDTFRLSCAWQVCGQRLLRHYQHAKSEHGALDFADLEWSTYRLLTRSQHAEWVQFKLDRRIDHLLVDEFQDTNPTQWRLLRPLLAEMTAGGERARSVFLVGDDKQSIYRFRRADARLFHEAHAWLAARAPVLAVEQQFSRRSAPAIMQFVNDLFDTAENETLCLPGFRTHRTHHPELWGCVELWPLIPHAPAPAAPAGAGWRDPLTTPRRDQADARYRMDATRIAARITTLIGTPVVEHGTVRPLQYGDILILLRDRTHAAAYENALRDAGIPYAGTAQSGLVECLEVQDLMALLRVLHAPHHNLALATILRSPLFAADTGDLLVFARDADESWFKQLLARPPEALPPALARARHLLAGWRSDVDRLPVHDLLDRIFCEGDVVGRYRAAAPAHLAARMEANLHRVLEIALELDCGRYPSIARFLAHLDMLGDAGSESTPAASGDAGRVHVMTVHGAKGLEAAVVFLADTARPPASRDRGPLALVDWPVTSERPGYMLLARRRAELDARTRELAANDELAARREEANLLYVAVTRARHLLCVTGCETARGTESGWYYFLQRRLQHAAAAPAAEGVRRVLFAPGDALAAVIESGAPPRAVFAPTAPAPATPVPDTSLLQPLPDALRESGGGTGFQNAPDEPDADGGDAAARQRGVAIHRMLELLTENERGTAYERCRAELGPDDALHDYDGWWREACAVVDDPELRDLFDAARYEYARNEVPLLFRRALRLDRLVVHRDHITLIDYKTPRHATRANVAALAQGHFEQMRFYAAGLRALWPDRPLHLRLLFTACRALVPVDEI
jgi:ATP-dependent helicase/nuclease subunit A